jgi:hypothetical protein
VAGVADLRAVEADVAVVAARDAFVAAQAQLAAISPVFPVGGVRDPLWNAYTRQRHRVRMRQWQLHRAILAHYELLTGVGGGGGCG